MSKRTLLTYFSSSSSSTPLETNDNTRQPKMPRVEFRCSDIISDPGLRKSIDDYPSEIRDQVKRAYVLRGPTQQALGFTYPRKWQSGEWRSFQQHWFGKYDWLEYSEAKDAAFCFYCLSSFSRESLKNLIVMSLQRLVTSNGKRLWKNLINMLLLNLITIQG